jgi:cytochrome c-type biogenesis protein CcmF
LLLAICLAMTGGALLLYALRAHTLKAGGAFQAVSREAALVLNNVLLSAILFTVAIGTFWPIVAEVLFGQRISAGGPYYVRTAVPLAALLALFMSIGVQLPWKRGSWRAALKRLRGAAAITLACAAASFWLSGQSKALSALGVAMAVWIVLGAAADIALRIQFGRVGWGQLWRRASNLPRSAWGGALAHAGLGVCVLGMVGTTLWASEALTVMRPGERLQVAGYTLVFDSIAPRNADNFQADTASFTVLRGDRQLAVLHPERRWFPIAQTLTTQAANRLTPLGDLYLVVGDPRGDDNGAYVVRAYVHPLVGLIWLGALIMVGGGVVSLSDGRYRIGAPLRRPASAPAALAAAE